MANRSSAISKFNTLLVGIAVIGVLVVALYTRDTRSRVVELTDQRHTPHGAHMAAPPVGSGTPGPEDARYESIRERLQALETLQEAVVSASKGALEQMNFVIAIVAGFFGLFSLFFGYRQLLGDTSRDEHDAEMRSLVSSFQNNINTISSLIGTLEKSYEFRSEVQAEIAKVRDKAELLENERERRDKTFDEQVAKLNEHAVELFQPYAERADLTAEDVARQLHEFAGSFDRVQSHRDLSDLINPFGLYMRGLHESSSYDYMRANSFFGAAEKKAQAHLANLPREQYAEHHQDKIRSSLRELAISCAYFQGVGYKNLGRYAESRRLFERSIEADAEHLQARTYLLQVQFFDTTIPLKEIRKRYEVEAQKFAVLREQNSERVERSFATLKINEGNMYLRKLIPREERSSYRQDEDQELALRCYREAHQAYPSDLSAFSVAQAMDGTSISSWKSETPEALYRQAMHLLKRSIAEDHDQLYSVMLYYMLAVCARRLERNGETAEVFLSQARYCLKQVPANVTCFSPISKIRLRRVDILEEMEKFESLDIRTPQWAELRGN